MSVPKPTSALMALLALAISLMLWLFIYPQYLPDQQTLTVTAKLSYQGLPPELVVTEIPERISLIARGDPSRLDALANAEVEAVVTFDEGTVPGRRNYAVTIVPPRFADLFPDLETAPVMVEQMATRRIPVEVETLGQLPDPTLVLDTTIPEPEEVTASGPESVIRELAKARVRLDLREITIGQNPPQFIGVEPVLTNNTIPESVTLDPKVIKVTPVIQSSPQQKSVSIFVPLEGGPPAGYIMAGYEVEPRVVRIGGTSRALAGVTQVSTSPIDVAGITSTTTFDAELRIPQGITYNGPRNVKVQVIVNPAPPNGGSNGE